MAKYQLSNFTDRQTQYPNRRRLKNITTNEEVVYDVYRAEGNITREGTPWNAATMNNFDKKIANTFTTGSFTPYFYAYKFGANAPAPYCIGSGANEADYKNRNKASYVTVNNLAFVHIEFQDARIWGIPSHTDYQDWYLQIGLLPTALGANKNSTLFAHEFDVIGAPCTVFSLSHTTRDYARIEFSDSVSATITPNDYFNSSGIGRLLTLREGNGGKAIKVSQVMESNHIYDNTDGIRIDCVVDLTYKYL
ncbi:MAG: hypothetical protein K2N51_17095 [Lachnospiraceae bacterium]|nr:hypothetical protein [Lachnospiraceae bacterium]